MEDTKQKCKKCLYCRNYTAYYIKGVRSFDSIRQGYCCQHNQIVAGCDSCEYWNNAYHRFYIKDEEQEIVLNLKSRWGIKIYANYTSVNRIKKKR